MKKIKFILAAFVLSLGFLFCFCLSVSVNAEEVVETETTDQINVVGVYEYNEEGKGNAKFTLYSDNTFVAELHDLERDETIEDNGTYILDGNVLIINTDNGVFKFKVNGNKLEPYEETIEKVETTQTIDPNSFLSHLKDFKWQDFEAVIGWVIAYLAANFFVILGFGISLVLKKVNEGKQSKAFQEAFAKLSLENQEKLTKLINDFETKLNNINADNQAFIESQKAEMKRLTNDNTKEIARDLAKISDALKDNE